VISVAFKTSLKTRLGICIDKTSHQHRPDEYIGFTPSCPSHILQQNCAHDPTHCCTLTQPNYIAMLVYKPKQYSKQQTDLKYVIYIEMID